MCRATVRRYMRRPKVAIRCDETAEWWTERLAVGIEALEVVAQRERARADFFEQALKWAVGEGPLPMDEEAEYDACLWYSWWIADGECDERLAGAFLHIRHLLVTELHEVPLEEPALRWSEVVGRLWLAARMREAWGHVNRAQRAIVEGNAVGAVNALQNAAERILVGQDELDELRTALLVEPTT